MNGIILGAGITGLSAGFNTGYPIFEARDVPGGICRSYYMKGYRFEIGGGHWIFGDPQAIKFLDRFSKLERYEKRSGVYINNIFPAPIQRHCWEEDRYNPSSMKGSIHRKFSKDLCKIFFDPFNEKYTAGLYNNVISENDYKTPSANDKGYNDVFYYPSAGLDVMVDEMAKENDIKYGKFAERIDTDKRVVYFIDGSSEKYDRIISTLPLDYLFKLTGENSNDLPRTAVMVVNIGAVPGPKLPKDHWIYVPFCDSGFFRVGFYSNIDKSFVPDKDKVSIYVETSFEPDILASYSQYGRILNIISELKDLGFIKNIDCVNAKFLHCAYTWRTEKSMVEKKIDLLNKKDILSIGRYGKWRFQGIAESVLDGLGVV